MNFLKTHLVWVIGIVAGLWLLTRLIGSKASAGANVSMPSGTSITYGGTNANDAAVQVAQLTQQSQMAAAQLAGNVAIQQTTIAAAAAADTNKTNLQLAQTQAANALAITNSNNAVAMQVTNNQTAVQMLQSYNQKDVATLQSNNALLALFNTNATSLAGLRDTNASKLAAYGIQAQVANNQTAALAQIAMAQIGADAGAQQTYLQQQAALRSQYMNLQYSELQSVLLEVSKSGNFNSEHGGANSVAAV
ncbi:MAG TPA: hypothetical protein VGE93_03655, partial [Bryobacteraceae bacterium]